MRQQKVRIAREPIRTATGRIAGWTLETDTRFIQCLWVRANSVKLNDHSEFLIISFDYVLPLICFA